MYICPCHSLTSSQLTLPPTPCPQVHSLVGLRLYSRPAPGFFMPLTSDLLLCGSPGPSPGHNFSKQSRPFACFNFQKERQKPKSAQVALQEQVLATVAGGFLIHRHPRVLSLKSYLVGPSAQPPSWVKATAIWPVREASVGQKCISS